MAARNHKALVPVVADGIFRRRQVRNRCLKKIQGGGLHLPAPLAWTRGFVDLDERPEDLGGGAG